MILPIRDCREVGQGKSGGERGRWLHSDAPYDGVGDPRLNKGIRSYLGKREKRQKEERKERKARRERRSVEDAGYSRVLTLNLKNLVTQVGLDVVLAICGQYQP